VKVRIAYYNDKWLVLDTRRLDLRDSDSPLTRNDLFRMDGRAWRVEYTNSSRAYCTPVTRGPEGVMNINISPNSIVERVTEADLTDPELERLAAHYVNEAEADAEAGGGTVAKAKAGKAKAGKRSDGAEKREKKLSKCLCGCGEMTLKFFYPGHDSRFKGWLISLERGKLVLGDLPAQARRAFDNLEFKFVKKGDGIAPTKNYKGEVHEGYVDESPRKRSARPPSGGDKEKSRKSAPSGAASLPV
jgi:hypothetical protein